MITLLSPSKTLNYNTKSITSDFTQCDFLESAAELVKHAQKLSSEDLQDLMKISKKIADLNKERFDRWSLPFNSENAKQAILAFDGGVYSGLDANNSFNQKDLDFAQDHLRILSGLYGLLKPLDLIQPYRLEMGIALKNSLGENLYSFWQNRITDSLNQTLRNHQNSLIVNCASNEYFHAIHSDKIKGQIINITFKEKRDGQLKFISFNAKKARGMISNYIVKNRVDSIEGLKDFSYDNYRFDLNLSSKDDLVFIR
jgi:cytoplasmic iron level regulating protein YaaA (DUF328/UPF0246 family)